MILQLVRNFLSFMTNMIAFFIVLCFACFYRKRPKKYVVFGTTPIISYTYWSKALKEMLPNTITLMNGVYSVINDKSDFDLYFSDVTPRVFTCFDSCYIRNFFALLFLIRNAKLFVTCYDSVCLGGYFRPFEIIIFRVAKVKTVLCCYGGDIFMYSRVKDASLQHALQLSYPNQAINELKIQRNVEIKNKYADFVMTPTFSINGIGRWDLLVPQSNVVDEKLWNAKKAYSYSTGQNNEIIICHAPNHRGFKGTEFIINAVEELILEGFNIKFILIEKKKNCEVKEIFKTADILVEQLIANGYGLNAVEGMASGLPVISNLSSFFISQVYRRYSFLNECPIVSGAPENIKDVLRVLIMSPSLREELGKAGRQYAEKYHSYKASQYMFGAIYDKIIRGKNIDLMNLFHPILSEYNKSMPFVKHPLINSQIPQKYLGDCS